MRNFGGDAIKKTRDAAVFLIKARYAVGRSQKAYFAGGSTGGREALAVDHALAADWDGAIAWYPAWNDAAAILVGHASTARWRNPAPIPNPAKRAAAARRPRWRPATGWTAWSTA